MDVSMIPRLRAELDDALAREQVQIAEAGHRILEIPRIDDSPVYGMILRNPGPRHFILFLRFQWTVYENEAPPMYDSVEAFEHEDFFEVFRQYFQILITQNGLTRDPAFQLYYAPPPYEWRAQRAATRHDVFADARAATEAALTAAHANTLLASESRRAVDGRSTPDIARLFAAAFPNPNSFARDLYWFIEPYSFTFPPPSFIDFASVFLRLADQASPGLYESLVTGRGLVEENPWPAPFPSRPVDDTTYAQAFIWFALTLYTGNGSALPAHIGLVEYQDVASRLSRLVVFADNFAQDALRDFAGVLRQFRRGPQAALPTYRVESALAPLGAGPRRRYEGSLYDVEWIRHLREVLPGHAREWNARLFTQWAYGPSREVATDNTAAIGALMEQLRQLSALIHTLAVRLQDTPDEGDVDVALLSWQPDVDETTTATTTTRPARGFVATGGAESDGEEDVDRCVICASRIGGPHGEPRHVLPCCPQGNIGAVCFATWRDQARQGRRRPRCPFCNIELALEDDVEDRPGTAPATPGPSDGSIPDYVNELNFRAASVSVDSVDARQNSEDWFHTVFMPEVMHQYMEKRKAEDRGDVWEGRVFEGIDASVRGPSEEEVEATRVYLVGLMWPLFQQRVASTQNTTR